MNEWAFLFENRTKQKSITKVDKLPKVKWTKKKIGGHNCSDEKRNSLLEKGEKHTHTHNSNGNKKMSIQSHHIQPKCNISNERIMEKKPEAKYTTKQ